MPLLNLRGCIIFCFLYGLLGHTDRFCIKARLAKVSPKITLLGWMRAVTGSGCALVNRGILGEKKRGDQRGSNGRVEWKARRGTRG